MDRDSKGDGVIYGEREERGREVGKKGRIGIHKEEAQR